MKRKTTEQFIKDARAVHGDEYDYSLVNYVGARTRVIIKCPIHGEFTQSPSNHLSGYKCPYCSGKTKTTKQFIQEAIVVHGNKYDYSLVDYVNSYTNVIIKCPTHGEFPQNPSNHLNGKGCLSCYYESIMKTTEQFIKEAIAVHGNKYDYSLVDYVNSYTNVIIKCPTHGEFPQNPTNHLKGIGCQKCSIDKKRKTTEQFIQEARAVHGDKYDYSLVKYINNKTPVIIKCREHGNFPQLPDNHLNGCDCPFCAEKPGKKPKTTEQFIKEARAIHGDEYDYSLVKYINANTPVIIKCLIHGNFTQVPSNHLNGHKCFLCYGKEKKTTEQFIKEAIAVHGNKYDYSLVDYVNSYTNVIIKCPTHGEFPQLPVAHLRGSGCSKCHYESNTKTTEQFIKEARAVHGNKYDYSLVKIINYHKKIIIKCPTHGKFPQTPASHIGGKGCAKCFYESRTKTTKQFIQEAIVVHGNKYDYSLVDYVNSYTNVIIKCPTHGEFPQNPIVHLKGGDCPKCAGFISKQQIKVFEFINSIYPNNVILEKYYDKHSRLDIVIPDLNLAIEFNGTFWHSIDRKPLNHLIKKQQYIKNNHNLHIINIFEDEWNKKKTTVKNVLKAFIEPDLFTSKLINWYKLTDKVKHFFKTHSFENLDNNLDSIVFGYDNYAYIVIQDNIIKFASKNYQEPTILKSLIDHYKKQYDNTIQLHCDNRLFSSDYFKNAGLTKTGELPIRVRETNNWEFIEYQTDINETDSLKSELINNNFNLTKVVPDCGCNIYQI